MDVKAAILNAYFIGAEHMKKEINSTQVEGRYGVLFEEGLQPPAEEPPPRSTICEGKNGT
jgi:hypothetical protein